eukprot:3937259-Rhodomonas_salina.1
MRALQNSPAGLGTDADVLMLQGMREAMPTVKLLVLLAGMLVCTFPFGAAKGVAFLAPANPQRLHPAHQTQPSRCASVVVTSLRKDGSEDEFRESFLGGLFRDVLPSQVRHAFACCVYNL